MRIVIAALVGATLIASSVGCGASKNPAWIRWGITKPTTEPGAEPLLAEAYRFFYEARFDTTPALYTALVERYPQSAEAHLGLSMTYRYTGNRDTARVLARRAYELDSAAVGVLLDYADLIVPVRNGPIPDMTDSARYAESDRFCLKAAASTHPFNAHANVQLLTSYMARARLADAWHQASELSRKHYYPQPLLDFAYNLLVGLEPDAILITNGDNDTYPPWVVQHSGDPFRPDVTVANMTLLNAPEVVRMLRDSLGLPVSFTDEEIANLKPRADSSDPEHIPPPRSPAVQVIDNVIANAAKANRTVYFAVTLGPEALPFSDLLVLEGLVSRAVVGGRTSTVDYDRLAENLTKKYRLGWPKALPPWRANMSPLTRIIEPLAPNYGFLFIQLASHYNAQNDEAKTDETVAQAVTWMKRSSNTAWASDYVETWLRRDPENAVAKKLKAVLDKSGTTQ